MRYICLEHVPSLDRKILHVVAQIRQPLILQQCIHTTKTLAAAVSSSGDGAVQRMHIMLYYVTLCDVVIHYTILHYIIKSSCPALYALQAL